MPSLTLMVQGTGSHVGKSILVAALCRIFRQEGLRVAPFKAQNMSNNAFVCPDGGEIGRAQALQASACGLEPAVEMNPILLKPCTDTGSQVVVLGRPVGTMKAAEYQRFKTSLLGTVRESLDRLRAAYDLVVIEGAGSPAEVNLRDSDIVNMRTAELADAPVLLVGDIDKGGDFAQLVGTLHLLQDAERARVRALVINKFRGDIEILRPGLDFLERETARPVLGVVPYLRDLRLPEEDTIPARSRNGLASRPDMLKMDVIRHPRIANFTDFDALETEPDVRLRYVEEPGGAPPDVLILPGTKSTIADLRWLKSVGFAEYLHRCLAEGTEVVGLCGGYQMLGQRIRDPRRVESESEVEEGLGLLPVETVFAEAKETAQVRAVHLNTGVEVRGYEIHMGRTEGAEGPVFRILERHGSPADEPDGSSARGGRVWGTYIHGVFDSGPFRRGFLDRLRARRGWEPLRKAFDVDLSESLDRLADRVRASLDMDLLRRIVRREA